MRNSSKNNNEYDYDSHELSEINVTPFIDVMLVLLIIFMVAAPMATVDTPVDLPPLSAISQPPADTPTYITLRADSSIFLQDQAVTAENIVAAINQLPGIDSDSRLYLRADQAVPYGEVIAIMNLLRQADFTKVSLVGLDAAKASNQP